MAVSTTVLIKGEDRTQAAFRQVQKNLSSLNKSFSGLKANLAGLVGTAGFGALSKSLIDTADQLGKTSARLGVSTKELQSLRFAAEQSGVATSTFDMALQRFTRRTAEAASGTGVAKDALDELGISIKDADGNLKSNEELLKEVAAAMPEVGSQADRVRIAFKLFDSEGVKMVNMLQGGRDNLETLQKQFESAGGVISDEFVVASEKLNDRLNLLSKTMSGNLSTALSGVVAQLAEGEQNLEGISATAQLVGRFLNFLLMGFKTLAEEIRFIVHQLTKGLGGTFEILTERAKELIARMTFGDVEEAVKKVAIAQADLDIQIAEGIKLHAKNVQQIEKEYEAGLVALGVQEKQTEEVIKQKEIIEETANFRGFLLSAEEETFELYEKEVEQARLLLGERKAGFQLTQKENDLFGKKLDQQFQQSQNFQRALDKQREHYQKVKKIVAAIDKLTPGGITSPSTFSAAKAIVGKTIESFDSFTQTLQGGLAGLSDQIFASAGAAGARAKGFIDSIKDSKNVQEAVVNGTLNLILSNEKVGEALGKVFEAIFALVDPIIESLVPVLDEIAEIFKELAPVFKLLMPAIKNSLAPLIGAAHALGEIAKIITKVADELSNLADKFSVNIGGGGSGGLFGGKIVPGLLEQGGPALRNQPYIVGEAGPELFIPSTSGRVIPNSQTMQPVVVNVYDGTGQKLSKYDSAIRVEIQNRADRFNQFPALTAA